VMVHPVAMGLETGYTKTYVALGSNLGDCHAHLNAAVASLSANGAIDDVVESPRYLTDPMGPPDQPDYLNSVCVFNTALDPHALLDELQKIEIERGRIRPTDEASIASIRWHARTLDLDLLLFGDADIHDERLTVPHSGIASRSFVLQPLFDLSPALTIKGLGSVAKLLSSVDKLGIKPAPASP